MQSSSKTTVEIYWSWS